MANYYGVARTNYVLVEDIEGLENALAPWAVEIVKNTEGRIALLGDDSDGSGWPTWGYDENDNEIELDVASVIMPLVKEGEVLVLVESGHEKMRYVTGYAIAWIRQGQEVRQTHISIGDIYQQAADKFGVSPSAISAAEY